MRKELSDGLRCSRRDFVRAAAGGLAGAGLRVVEPPLLAQAKGDRPNRAEGVKVLNPESRVPISFIIDGKFCDGGDDRQFGWGRFSAGLMSANGGRTLRIAQDVLGLRLYHRSLRTSEAIGNFRAGPPPASR